MRVWASTGLSREGVLFRVRYELARTKDRESVRGGFLYICTIQVGGYLQECCGIGKMGWVRQDLWSRSNWKSVFLLKSSGHFQ
jgi:hypothetical protein